MITATPDGYDLTSDTSENSLGVTDGIAYGDGSYFNGDVYEVTVASGSAVATGVNVLVVNDWYDSAGSTDYHGLCGISADTFS